jgi:hypothetical protein
MNITKLTDNIQILDTINFILNKLHLPFKFHDEFIDNFEYIPKQLIYVNLFDVYDKYFEYIVKIHGDQVESLKVLIDDLLTEDVIHAHISDRFVLLGKVYNLYICMSEDDNTLFLTREIGNEYENFTNNN